MALSCSPKLLLADEPTTALDVTVQAQILELLLRLREEFGSSIVLITHDMGVVAEVADRVMVMYGGRIVERGTKAVVLGDPQHPYTAALLESIPPHGRATAAAAAGHPGQPAVAACSLPPGCAFAPRCRSRHAGCARRPALVEADRPRRRLLPAPPDGLGARHDQAPAAAGGDRSQQAVHRSARRLFARDRRRAAGRGRRVAGGHAAARRLGLVGESGCGKSTLGPLPGAPLRPHQRPAALRGPRDRRPRPAPAAPDPPPAADGVPGPLGLAQPAPAGRRPDRRAAARPRPRHAQPRSGPAGAS